MNIEIPRCREFDLFCYRAFIKYIYSIDNLEKLDVDAAVYLEIKKKDFQKPYLNQKKKLQKTMEEVKKLDLDVLFMQETNQQLRKMF